MAQYNLWLLAVVVLVVGTCFHDVRADDHEEINAQRDGKVTTDIETSLEDFQSKRHQFKMIIADETSTFCKRSEGNCRVRELHVRSGDIVIIDERSVDDKAQVEFYIRKRFEPTETAIYRDHLASMLRDREEEIRERFSHRIAVTDPPPSGWEPWRIAVTVIGSVAGLAIVIGAVAVGMRRKSQNEAEKEKAVDQENRLSMYDNVAMTTGTEHTYTELNETHPEKEVKFGSASGTSTPSLNGKNNYTEILEKTASELKDTDVSTLESVKVTRAAEEKDTVTTSPATEEDTKL